MPTSARRLLDVLVHRQRLHLARAAGRDEHLDLDRLVRAVAGFRQQLLRLLRIVGDVELRLAEPGLAGSTWPLAGTVMPPSSSLRPSRSTARLAALRTRISFQGEPFDPAQVPRPDMRVDVGDDLKTGLLQAAGSHPAAAPRSNRPDRRAAPKCGWRPPGSAPAPACRASARGSCPSSPCGTSSARSRASRTPASTARCRRLSRRTCSSPCRLLPNAPGSRSGSGKLIGQQRIRCPWW